MPSKSSYRSVPSEDVFVEEYGCPCGYVFISKGGGNRRRIDLVVRLHKKRCVIAKGSEIEITTHELESQNGTDQIPSNQ